MRLATFKTTYADYSAQNHWSEARAAMNVSTECEAWLALPVVAQFRRWTARRTR